VSRGGRDRSAARKPCACRPHCTGWSSDHRDAPHLTNGSAHRPFARSARANPPHAGPVLRIRVSSAMFARCQPTSLGISIPNLAAHAAMARIPRGDGAAYARIHVQCEVSAASTDASDNRHSESLPHNAQKILRARFARTFCRPPDANTTLESAAPRAPRTFRDVAATHSRNSSLKLAGDRCMDHLSGRTSRPCAYTGVLYVVRKLCSSVVVVVVANVRVADSWPQ
jgi:hypothetical protein